MGSRGRRLGPALRLAAVLALAWAVAGPFERPASGAGQQLATPTPTPAPRDQGAGGQPPPPAPSASPPAPDAGFSVAPGVFADYFRARGGARTFGPPLSNRFPLLGDDVQLFRHHVLRLDPDGSVRPMDLLGIGAVPSLRVGGRTLPPADPQLAAGAPVPGAPDYAARAQEFIRANAPDRWEGLPVGFYAAFLGTVTLQDAFPGGGGDPGLLPGFAQEVWGLPTSRPTRDPQQPELVYLRWERGVMQYDGRAERVDVVPLGEFFKAVLTGEDLPPDLAAEARGSRFYRQFDPSAPDGVARPAELPDTTLLAAFQPAGRPGPPAAAGSASTPSPTPSPTPSATPSAIPSPTPSGTLPATPSPGPGATGTGVATSGPSRSGTPGADPCYGDERISYSPEDPRAGTELLITVTSARPHPYGRLAGTERATFVRERPGQLGIVYEYSVALSQPGDHEYTYYVDSTIPCERVSIRVRPALGAQPATSGDNDNDNDNGNVNDNGSDVDNDNG